LSVGLEDNNVVSGQIISRYAKSPPNITISGETPGSFPAQNWIVAAGRGLLDSDVDGLRDVCVLGSTLAEDLFPFGSPLGERIELNRCQIHCGRRARTQRRMAGGRQDEFALIPVTTGINRYEDKRWLNLSILVQARSAADYDARSNKCAGSCANCAKCRPANRMILRLLPTIPSSNK
jgi:hypothetical protein